MNRTEAIKTLKLSDSMVSAILTMTYKPYEAKREGHTGYSAMENIHPRTRKALHDRGLMFGHYYLTASGLEVFTALGGAREDLKSNVTIVGEHTEPEDAFLSIAEQTAWQRQEGVCNGLCAIGTGCEHCDTNYGHLEPQTDAESVDEIQEETSMTKKFETVSVIQSNGFTSGVIHYHAPGCRDIEREVKHYNSKAYTEEFECIMDILIYEFGEHASDDAEENTPEWYSALYRNATGDEYGGVRIMPCLVDTDIPNGETNDGSPLVIQGNFFRSGFKRPSPERVEKLTAMLVDDSEDAGFVETDSVEDFAIRHHDTIEGDESPLEFPCIKVNGVVTHKGLCVERFGVAGMCCSLENDPKDYEDVPLADWERELLESATTKHSDTMPKGQWTHYEHTLNAGDVVKVVGKQGVYEVHCVVPGVDVVYLLGTQGEPSPYPAHDVYAI